MAIVATTCLVAGLEWQSARTTIAAGFWFDDAVAAADQFAAELGGALTPDETTSIERVARLELERAFSGLQISFTDARRGFWRVRVLPSVTFTSFNGRMRVNAAGLSNGFGPLGGSASLNFNTLALNAVRYAPAGASRQQVVEAIGRGIGRAAAHEFAHLIVQGAIDTRVDENAYEYFSADRASQYYGELRWTNAWPMLQRKIGR